MTTEFVVVRHGETDENRNGILQGQSDTKLNEQGLRQADCVADRLKTEKFDLIYSSDLSRTMITAEKIAAFHHLPVYPLHALREWNLGVLQGGKSAELRIKYPEIMASFANEGSDVTVPGGESRMDLNQRVADCLDEMCDRFAGKRILLVSHGGTIRAMFRHVVGAVSEHSRLPLTSNAGVSSFRCIDGVWQLTGWNDTSHLNRLKVNESVTF